MVDELSRTERATESTKAKSRTPSREDKEEEERKRRAERKKVIVSIPEIIIVRRKFESKGFRGCMDPIRGNAPSVSTTVRSSNVEVMDRRLVRPCPCITLMPSLRWLVDHVDPFDRVDKGSKPCFLRSLGNSKHRSIHRISFLLYLSFNLIWPRIFDDD